MKRPTDGALIEVALMTAFIGCAVYGLFKLLYGDWA